VRAGEVEAYRNIAELEDQVREKVSLFKFVKCEQGYKDRAEDKLPRYPLEDDVVEGDRVDFMPLCCLPLLSLRRVESFWSSPVSGVAATHLVEPAAETVDDIVGVALTGSTSEAAEEPRLDVSNV